MLISMDILAHELEKHVSCLHLQPNTRLEISSCQLLDEPSQEFRREFVYLVLPKDYDALPTLPPETNVICVGESPSPLSACEKLNLMVIRSLTFIKVINAVIDIFQKYNDLGTRLDSALQSSDLKGALNAAANLLQQPVNMIDLNHNTLACSTNIRPEGDPLWDAIYEGYGYEHYAIVSSSLPKLADMDESGVRVHEGISNISGRNQRVYLLRRGAKGVAAFGLHKLSDYDQPFGRHTVQLADYVVDRISSQLDMFSEVTFARGKLYERFLVDLLDGKPCSPETLEVTMKSLSIQVTRQYRVGLVLFKNPTVQTGYHFSLMNYLESLLPSCKCALHKSRIVVLCPQKEGERITRQLETQVAEFLNQHDCFFLLSNSFSSLLEMRGMAQALEAVIPYLEPMGTPPRFYHYYQYAEQHSLCLLSHVLPLSLACHPFLLELLQHDKENHSDYYRTLVTYLRCDCNITEASKLLQIHRNSLLYRINKIEAILDSRLDDSRLREQLLFSIQCLEFEKNHGTGLNGLPVE